MTVEVTLPAPLAQRAAGAPPGGRGPVVLPADATVAVLAAVLGLAPATAVFVVNGTAATVRHPLRDGDRVRAYPAAAGG